MYIISYKEQFFGPFWDKEQAKEWNDENIGNCGGIHKVREPVFPYCFHCFANRVWAEDDSLTTHLWACEKCREDEWVRDFVDSKRNEEHVLNYKRKSNEQ